MECRYSIGCATVASLRPRLELGRKDMRRAPLEERKRALATLLRRAGWALHFNDHIDEAGDIVFRHACKLGFEGIVLKRLGSPYRSGRSRDWIKTGMAPAQGRQGRAGSYATPQRWRRAIV